MSSTIAFTRKRNKNTRQTLWSRRWQKNETIKLCCTVFLKNRTKTRSPLLKDCAEKEREKIPQKNDINRCDERV